MTVLVNYIKGSIDELRHVVWPTRRQVIEYTVIVLVSVGIATGLVVLVDYGLEQLVNQFLLK